MKTDWGFISILSIKSTMMVLSFYSFYWFYDCRLSLPQCVQEATKTAPLYSTLFM